MKNMSPEVVGQRDALISQGFAHRGEVMTVASTLHLCFAGAWHRLTIDCGVVFWRQSSAPPEPWAIESDGFEYPLTDIGSVAGVLGRRLEHYRIAATATATYVAFHFDNGRTIILEGENDHPTIRVS